MRPLLLAYLAAVNLAAFALYALDKRRARRRMWRVSEAALLAVAALGGSLGALLGIHLLHHKTRRARFTLLVPAFLMIHTALSAWLLWRFP